LVTFFFSGVKGLEHEVNQHHHLLRRFERAELYLCSGYMPLCCGQGQLYCLPGAM
jgi:hypothetical protein